MTQPIYNPELQKQLRDYSTECGSQEKAARKIGFSGALLSQYLNSKYHEKGGDVEQVEDRLREFFRIEEEAAALYVAKGYVPTSISEVVYKDIKICHLSGGMLSCVGDPGIGKTMGIQQYISHHPKDTIMITMNPCLSSPKSCLRLLCQRLDISEKHRQDDTWLAIESKLRGSRKVIVIDEAQHLTAKSLDTLRAFSDNVSELGIVLVGNIKTVRKRINSSGMVKEEYEQIESRTYLTDILHTCDLSLDDVHLLFPGLPQMEQELMLAIMQSPQGIRKAVSTMEIAVRNENVTYDGLVAAAKLSGALRSWQAKL